MIWIKSTNEKPLFTVYVNGVNERDVNGGKIKTYILGTRESKQDGTREYSTWFAQLFGNASKLSPQKGDVLEIYSFKQKNVSKKNDDGTFNKPYFDFRINEMKIKGKSNNQTSNYESQCDGMPF